MIDTKYYLDLEGLTKIILQLSEIIQSKTSDLVSQEAINKFATIKTILDTNLSIGLNENGSHIKTEGKFTNRAETIAEEISALDTELYSLKEEGIKLIISTIFATEDDIKEIFEKLKN